MYIRLGDTNIKYSNSQDDFIIFSQILDSEMSYEKPVLVRTPDELEIWFGRNFSGKDYLDQLLGSGVTLLLYRPVSSEENIYGDDYIDTSSFEVSNEIYSSPDMLPEVGREGVKYNVSGEYYIYLQGEYVKEKDLPQNITNNTQSLNNRDTLNINYVGYTGPKYCFPIYRENNLGEVFEYPEVVSEEDRGVLLSHLPDPDKVLLGYETLGFYLTTEDSLSFQPTGDLGLDTKYIILTYLDRSSGEYKKMMVWFEGENNIIPTIPSYYYTEGNTKSINIIGKSTLDILQELVEIMRNDIGYSVEESTGEGVYKVYAPYSVPVTYFYNIPGFSLEPSISITHNILSQVSKGNTRIRFISKTIGMDTLDGVDCNIRVKIEKLKEKDKYRITLSRYNYYEVFEGGLFTVGEDRIDSKITKESKLVRCETVTTYIDEVTGKEVPYTLEEGGRNSELPEGTWDLRRATSEKEYTREMYWKAVDSILGADDPVYIDYFLIPDISPYVEKPEEGGYYKEYDKFLELSQGIGCQVLIENKDNGWRYEELENIPENPESGVVYIISGKYLILGNDGSLVETTDPEITNKYGNNFIFNYTGDKDNRLVWFFRGITINGYQRPGYYLHIQGLLGGIFSMSSSKVIYNNPTSLPYSEEEIEKTLKEHKSNYLVYNNQEYYYKEYQNGEEFNTSGWMRFCIGKVYRELEKHKWEILGQKSIGDMKENLGKILSRISGTFTYINSLTLLGLYTDIGDNRLGVEIESRMSDLVDNDIVIDITLNYDKEKETINS